MQSRRLLQLFTLGTYFASNSTIPPPRPIDEPQQPLLADKMPRGAVLCISHGGGPMPLLDDPLHASITDSLRTRAPQILSLSSSTSPPPRAIILVTAHWQTAIPTLSSGPSHRLYYDYSGFPPETYKLKYPAPGSPSVAAEAHALLAAAGIDAVLDPVRGWDHGVFVPMTLIHPAADVPVVQLSILASEDAAQHLALGRALAPLRDSNVAIVGSGFASFHNLRHMLPLMHAASSPLGPAREQRAALQRIDRFNHLLVDTIKSANATERDAGLLRWREFEGSYDAHPPHGADHFMPLLVCAGASLPGEEARMYRDDFVGAAIWSFYWGANEVK